MLCTKYRYRPGIGHSYLKSIGIGSAGEKWYRCITSCNQLHYAIGILPSEKDMYLVVLDYNSTTAKRCFDKDICNTLHGRFKGNSCATNVMLHSKILIWNAVTTFQISIGMLIFYLKFHRNVSCNVI